MYPIDLKRLLIEFFGFKRLGKHCLPVNSYDFLKFLAVITMIIDHLGEYFFPDISIFRSIGRFAFPVFLFLIGYSGKFNARYNLLTLGLIISCLQLFIEGKTLDILVTIFLSCIFMQFLEKRNYLNPNNSIQLFIIFFVWNFGLVFLISYGATALMFVTAGYLYKNFRDDIKTKIFLFLTIIYNFIYQSLLFKNFDTTSLSIFFIVSILLYFLFKDFSIKNINFDKFRIIELVSRNALPVYFIHKALFIIASASLSTN